MSSRTGPHPTLGDAPFHNVHWKGDIDLSLDCFIADGPAAPPG
ncbi:hypothetical protein [Micromonospora sp. LH3U1]|nr:hypothetical protein [Micromonospora sp. LH3U1]WCN83199.1 hypothetical protein PCA76_09185 [Micromonospora sp. LH3U1]